MSWAPSDVTVAVNVRDGSAFLDGWSAGLAKQPQGFQVLVLDDGSQDDTADRLEAGDGREVTAVLRRPPRGLQAARRELLEHVTTPLVLILDIDIELDADVLPRFLEAMTDEVAAVTGRTRNRTQTGVAEGHDAVRQWLYDRRGRDTPWVEGSPTMWRTEVLRGLGGTSDAAISEDLDISHRAREAGWQLRLLDDIVATHPDPATWKELWRRERHTGLREGRMQRGGRSMLGGARVARVLPLTGPLYVLGLLASAPLLARLPHHKWRGYWVFHGMNAAYAVGFAKAYMERKHD